MRRPDSEKLRVFDLLREGHERLVALKEAVYGRPVDRAVFEWQYFRHPRSREIRVFVVEHGGEIVASTTRLPAALRIDGVDHAAYFNIDSMVHPGHRRRGRMRDLYQLAGTSLPARSLLFSKGSSPQIYPLLMSIGHREIVPSTYLVSYPSATRWLLSRLSMRTQLWKVHRPAPEGFDDFQPIRRFGSEHAAFIERASGGFRAMFRRDAAFMNWRYVDIPHRRYACFARRERSDLGRITSIIVLACSGEHAHIVDLVWDQRRADEPERAIRFAHAYFDEQEAVRVACFATHPRLREALSACGFLDRGETPRFSALVPPELEAAFEGGAGLHAVDGDGDTEFS